MSPPRVTSTSVWIRRSQLFPFLRTTSHEFSSRHCYCCYTWSSFARCSSWCLQPPQGFGRTCIDNEDQEASTMRKPFWGVIVLAMIFVCIAGTRTTGMASSLLAAVVDREAQGANSRDLLLTASTAQELGAMVLLGTVLFGLAGAARRRMRR